nr:putative reverse transcriptase domain-containing protein [Tanacetum cinerariifolium]
VFNGVVSIPAWIFISNWELPAKSAVLKARMLTNEAIRNEVLKKIFKKRANNKEPSRDGNARDDNKSYRMRKAFVTTTNPVRKEYTSNAPKCTKACFKCGGMDHYKEACRRLNRALRPQGNHQNHAMVGEGGQVRGKNGNQAHGRAFMMGAGDAHQDPNIVMELFSDYDCEIRYHLGKENIVALALCGKERFKPNRIRVMNMTIFLSIKDKILAAQNEASEAVNAPAEMLGGLDDQFERRSDGALYYLYRIWVLE